MPLVSGLAILAIAAVGRFDMRDDDLSHGGACLGGGSLPSCGVLAW
jgi:hypothetical protein